MKTALKWFYQGYVNYGKSGFEKAKKEYFQESDVDQENIREKRFLVTGAGSGLGYSTSLQLAKRGGTVYMICRDLEKYKSALEEIKSETGNQSVYMVKADVSLMSDCKNLMDYFRENNIEIDVIIHNAGVMKSQKEITPEGFESTFATNVLGPYYITKQFLNQQKEQTLSKPRVIFVSSGGMLTQKLSSDYQFEHKKGKWDPLYTYSQTKRAMVYLAELFTEKYGDEMNFYSCHPGWCHTPQLETAMPIFHSLTKGIQRSPEQGADTPVWLSVSPTVESKELSGLFYQDRKPVSKYINHSHTESTKEEIDHFWNYLSTCIEKTNL